MSNVRFSLPEYAERYEYIRRDLDQKLETSPANNTEQRKDNYTFTFEERSAIYDWSKAYIFVGVRLERRVGTGGAGNEHSYGDAVEASLINGIHSLIRRISMQGPDGQIIYDVPEVNKALFVKKLLEYGPDYAETVGTNELWFLDTGDTPASARGKADPENAGHVARRNLLVGPNDTQPKGRTVFYRIPLKSYSFFESLDFNNVLLSGMSLKLVIDIETDNNLILRAPGVPDGRVVLDKFEFWVPQVTLHPSAAEQYNRSIDQPVKWSYMRERVERSSQLTNSDGRFRITGVNKPKKAFFWFSTVEKDQSQVFNMYAFDSLFSVDNLIGIGRNQTLQRARLEFDDGSFYPHTEYTSDQIHRLYHDVQEYAHRNDDDCCGSQLTRNNYDNMYSLLYFNLDYQKQGTVSDNKDMTFIWTLPAAPVSPYYIYSLLMYENDASFGKISNRFTILSEISK